MSEIATWLEKLGLSQYTETFAKHDIDIDVLPALTEEHLKELGISLGHRVKLLNAVSSLTAQQARESKTSKRRQLTVMFIDLVIATAIARQSDPEDRRKLMLVNQQTITSEIARYDGYIARYTDHGVLVYFGWPQEHEDDAERAVRAGIAIAAAVAQLYTYDNKPLAARIGIATGLVAVEGLISAANSQEGIAIGDTPRLAVRLQGLAGPGQVVLGARTHRLISDKFDYQDIGLHQLKGFSESIRAWRVVVEEAVRRLQSRMLMPLVGRDQEERLLLERWAQAQSGHGQVVLLFGEPGIGKTRLIQAMREKITESSFTTLIYQCSPEYTNSALYPVMRQLDQSLGFGDDRSTGQKLDKLQALFKSNKSDSEDLVVLLATQLAIPVNSNQHSLNLNPQRRKQKIHAALIDQVIGLSQQQPVLLIVEDAHWIDSTTHDLIKTLLRQIKDQAILILISLQPESAASWSDTAPVTTVPLNRLSRSQAKALIYEITAGKTLPGDVLEQIVDKTEGVPLFVEQMTRAVLGSGLLRDSQGSYVLDGLLRLPGSLQDALMAQFDQLGQAKQIAQRGAVIGRVFQLDVLEAISAEPIDILRRELDKLINASLLDFQSAAEIETYEFKHVLVRDVAYGSLSNQARAHLHATVADNLLSEFPDIVSRQPELLAHHLTLGVQYPTAIDYWQRAAAMAEQQGDYPEAIARFKKGLELLAKLPDNAETMRIGAALLNGLGNVMITTEGAASHAVRACFERAQRYSEKAADKELQFSAYFGLWVHAINIPKVPQAEHCAKQLLILADGQAETELQLQAHHASWTDNLLKGNFGQLVSHTEKGYALYQLEPYQQQKFRHGGHDAGVCALQMQAFGQCLLGYSERAQTKIEQAVVLAERLQHPFSTMYACIFAAMVYERSGLPKQVEAHVIRASEVALRDGIKWAPIVAMHGWIMNQKGRHDEGIAQMQEALSTEKFTGSSLIRLYQLVLLAEALISVSRLKDATYVLEQTFAEAKSTGEYWWDAELHRLQGLLLNKRGDESVAIEASYRASIRVARAQSAKLYELRAAYNLARHWRSQGKNRIARDVLIPVYSWFNEGFATADLKAAKALLDMLA